MRRSRRPGELSGLEAEALAHELQAGDLGVVAKLKETGTGDTLCGDDKSPFQLPSLPEISPVIGYAVKPKTKADEDKIGTALSKLCEADPTLRVERDTELHVPAIQVVNL